MFRCCKERPKYITDDANHVADESFKF